MFIKHHYLCVWVQTLPLKQTCFVSNKLVHVVFHYLCKPQAVEVQRKSLVELCEGNLTDVLAMLSCPKPHQSLLEAQPGLSVNCYRKLQTVSNFLSPHVYTINGSGNEWISTSVCAKTNWYYKLVWNGHGNTIRSKQGGLQTVPNGKERTLTLPHRTAVLGAISKGSSL